jgi:hypothetical protein
VIISLHFLASLVAHDQPSALVLFSLPFSFYRHHSLPALLLRIGYYSSPRWFDLFPFS